MDTATRSPSPQLSPPASPPVWVHGPGAGEGRSVATALTALAQQPDASATITRTLFVGLAMIESTAIYCFVVSMILIFANPFWNHVIAQRRESNAMLIDWFTVVRRRSTSSSWCG
jgi:F-type H+-transporting ATPase subunit c